MKVTTGFISRLVVFAAVCAALGGQHAFSQQPIPSPRDSAKIVIKGKTISVDYGRPSMRGRTIMGELVPFNKVWRTGANEATAFVTEADLEIGDVQLPRGSYTLYTLPSESQWKLIINKQTGQWGTVYNAELDFARIDLQKRMLKKPVEKFLISFKRRGKDGGILLLEWERTSLSVQFRVKEGNRNNSSKSIM